MHSRRRKTSTANQLAPPIAGKFKERSMLNLALLTSGFIGLGLMIYIRHRLYE